MEELLIVGCGYVGTALAEAAMERGAAVHALVRSEDKAAALRKMGVSAFTGDIASTDWHRHVPDGVRWIVNCVSSGGGGIAGYRHAYVEGQRSVVELARSRRPHCVLYTGSTTVYPQTGGVEVDEESVPDELPAAAAVLLEAERVLLHAGLAARTVVLRLSGIYGPGRHHLLDQVRGGGPLAGTGAYFLNLIHRDDIVRAILVALDSPLAGGVYNISDGQPHTRAEVAAWLAGQLGLPPPVFDPSAQTPRAARRSGPEGMPDRRVSNRKAREQLGWSPTFSSFREGFGSILRIAGGGMNR